MKMTALAIAATLGVANAQAGCPELDALAKRYGISFSGFDKPIPATQGPAAAEGSLLHLPIAYPEIVSDGFRHTLLFDATTRKAWILRTGGFVGVHEWYGPVDVGDSKLENCRPEPRPAQSVRVVERSVAG